MAGRGARPGPLGVAVWRLRRRAGRDEIIKGCPAPRPCRALARAASLCFPSFSLPISSGGPGDCGQGRRQWPANSARLICTAHALPRPPALPPAPAVRRRPSGRLRCTLSPVCPMGFFAHCALLLLLHACAAVLAHPLSPYTYHC